MLKLPKNCKDWTHSLHCLHYYKNVSSHTMWKGRAYFFIGEHPCLWDSSMLHKLVMKRSSVWLIMLGINWSGQFDLLSVWRLVH